MAADSVTLRGSDSNSATLVGNVVNTLRADIVGGTVDPGARLNIDALAQRFGVSIIPIREALRVLQAEGLVTREPNKGYRVRPASMDDFEETYRLRSLLDPLAVWLAVPNLESADFRALAVELDALRECEADGNADAYYQHHLRFHFGIYNRCNQPWLLRLITSLYNNSDRYRAGSAEGPLSPRSAEHQAVLEASQAGDALAAAKHMEQHLQKTLVLRGRQGPTEDPGPSTLGWPKLAWETHPH